MILLQREKNLLKLLGIVAVCAALFLYVSLRKESIDPIGSNADNYYAEPRAEETPRATPTRSGGSRGGSSAPAKAATISLSDFENHNTLNDCWALIQGRVYDVSPYLTSIPHRSEAAPFCGTFAFEEGFIRHSESLRDSVISLSVFKGVISQS